MDKIDSIVQEVVKEFERRPIVTTLKGAAILWVLKQVSNWWKN